MAGLILFAAGVFGVLGGCDAVDIRSHEVEERPEPDNEVQADEPFDRADLLFEPVSLSSGETFSIELIDERHDRGVTRITHERTPGGEQEIRARFDPLDPASVTVECRNQKANTSRKMTTLAAAELDAKSQMDAVATADEEEPSSYHYIEDGDNVIVEVDYDTEGGNLTPAFEFTGSDEPVACTHVSFVLEDVSQTLAATGVRFRGDVEAPPVRKRDFR